MDVNGLVIAASEVIRFEDGCGIMLTICNKKRNFTFYILATDEKVLLWKKVFVNHFYKFSNLKIGAIEWLSSSKKIVLVTTSKSEYHEILGNEVFTISNQLMEKISIPDTIFNSDIQSFSKLISYQGVITKVENAKLGIYELDNKIYLYCIFNSLRTPLYTLRENDEAFISNAHYFTDFKARKILVCCGLSSVRVIKAEVEAVNSSPSSNLRHYPLSIFDVIWLESLFTELNTNFSPEVISSDFTFHWENEILNNILECFSYPLLEASSSNRKSIGDEYCSNPHSCSAFCNDILPTGCEILCISEILNRAFRRIHFTATSDSWKTCFVQNEAKYILIGMLYMSKEGCWYIMDKSSNIPIVFTRNCDHCKFFKNMFCSFQHLNLGYLIAVQSFDIVYEKVKYHFSDYDCYRYLKTSCCCLFYLGTFCKDEDNCFNLVSVQEDIPLHINDSVEEITQSLKITHLDKQDLWLDKNSYLSTICNEDLQNNNNNTSQHVLVLNKIWTLHNQTFVCYQTIVLLLPLEEIHEEYLNKSKSLFGDSINSNFYETDDDTDFAELINQLDSLYLEDKPRLARLHFESTRQCALMLPGHIYTFNFSGKLNKDVNLSVVSNNSKPVLIKIKTSMKILHRADCLGNHYPDEFEIDVYNNIEQIISERKVPENSLIRAVLEDKLYEESFSINSSQREVATNKTFCLILKDCDSEDTIKAYLPFCPKNMYGFLPGIQVQMWGFVCICSKRGYLYLKPLSSFGLQIIHSDAFYADKSLILESDCFHSELRVSSLHRAQINIPFKCICFIIRIVSVKLHLICSNCGQDFMQKCPCLCAFNVKSKMSFIIDDGTDQVLTHCSDETVRKILMLKENEWEKITSYVMETKSCLDFYYKMIETDSSSASLMDKVFSVYCSSKFTSRQVCLKCIRKSGGLKYESSIWCCDVLQVHKTDLISELIMKVKDIHA